jgi:hypothetical protein
MGEAALGTGRALKVGSETLTSPPLGVGIANAL